MSKGKVNKLGVRFEGVVVDPFDESVGLIRTRSRVSGLDKGIESSECERER